MVAKFENMCGRANMNHYHRLITSLLQINIHHYSYLPINKHKPKHVVKEKIKNGDKKRSI